jgi:hypothetical protein
VKKHRVSILVLVAVMALVSIVPAMAAPAGLTLSNQSMQSVWNRTDQPVASLVVSRTWIWGPEAFDSRAEAYAESPGGQRQVVYFDKSRMEMTNPNGVRNSQWFITNGLLAKELISGQMQVGDAKFENRTPAQIPVAGDPNDTNGPTYAAFAGLLGRPARNVGDELTETVDRNGNVGTGGPGGVRAAYFVPETNHAVASVFWNFVNSSGTVWENGRDVQGKLFDPTFFATGFPITEAYWAQVKVGGNVQWVLIQVFERRVLTYTPNNPEGWKVEMGNIGRHYHDWRYGGGGTPVSNLPTGWTLLDDSANGYRAGVPQGWVSFRAGTPEMQQYIDALRQANAQSAQNIQDLINAGLLKSIGLDASQSAAASGFVTNFNVVKETVPEGTTLDQYIAASVTQLGQVGIAAEWITQQKINTQYGEVGVLKYQTPAQGTQTIMSLTQYVGVKSGAAFILTLTTTTAQQSNYQTIIDQMGQNFQFGI